MASRLGERALLFDPYSNNNADIDAGRIIIEVPADRELTADEKAFIRKFNSENISVVVGGRAYALYITIERGNGTEYVLHAINRVPGWPLREGGSYMIVGSTKQEALETMNRLELKHAVPYDEGIHGEIIGEPRYDDDMIQIVDVPYKLAFRGGRRRNSKRKMKGRRKNKRTRRR
jgi:hypothetical protein